MKFLDRAASVAVIFGVVVFLALVVRGELHKTARTDGSAKALVGKSISVSGVDFSKQRDTLVLALSTSCHFCKDSLPFYKQLALQNHGHVDLVAVFLNR